MCGRRSTGRMNVTFALGSDDGVENAALLIVNEAGVARLGFQCMIELD